MVGPDVAQRRLCILLPPQVPAGPSGVLLTRRVGGAPPLSCNQSRWMAACHMENDMQNIHIGRYSGETGYSGWVQPEDRTWILFIDDEGKPSLFVEVECQDEEGKVEHGYMPAGYLEDTPNAQRTS